MMEFEELNKLFARLWPDVFELHDCFQPSTFFNDYVEDYDEGRDLPDWFHYVMNYKDIYNFGD